jgi:glycine/D-amino acid oxidase-like deaminating enzyme
VTDRHAIIVGGGVTGLSSAYHLKRLGYGEVTLFEKDSIGAGSSSRAAGISTGLLWSKTGVLARKTALRRFREMSRELDNYQFHNEHGCLGLFSPELWPAREALLPLYDELDAPYQILSADEIRRRWPQLNPEPGHIGLLDPLGGFSEPPQYLAALTARCRQLGVRIVEAAAVREIVVEGDRAAGVRTDEGVVRADAVVVANYSWIVPLLATAGISIPAKTFVHQRYVTTPFEAPFAAPPVNADPYLGYVRPAAGNRILIGAETPDRDDVKVGDFAFRLEEIKDDPAVLPAVLERFGDFVPALRGAEWETRKVGLLSFSMDGEPILGPFGKLGGLFVGVCFHSGGFSYNPASGFYLAEFVANGKTSIDLSAFSPDRFVPAETDAYLKSTVPQRNAARRRH